MAVDRSSRKSLHSIELSRIIPSKPHKFDEGIFFFGFFFGFVSLFVGLFLLFVRHLIFAYLILLGHGILFSAEQSTYINLLSLGRYLSCHYKLTCSRHDIAEKLLN